MRHAKPRSLALLAALLLASGAVLAQSPTLDERPPRVAEPLKPGAFEWAPERSLAGPVMIVVSIDDQLAHVYRGGVRIATTTVSTGRPGNPTPTGVFTILQKKKMHHSNLYDDAPMPFMQRLTWDGVALHAGRIPGHPASHGCVRLPAAFAEKLFDVTYHGGTVVVMDSASMASLDLAKLPADMARLVFDRTWQSALPGAIAGDATRLPTTAASVPTDFGAHATQ
ncbi:MAG TPA: L,D-transpeptidase family protein [Opitutaceae bacterium]|nr:L,D-transpeptidase family protein [Opitutaceae bacterium]